MDLYLDLIQMVDLPFILQANQFNTVTFVVTKKESDVKSCQILQQCGKWGQEEKEISKLVNVGYTFQ